MDFSNDPSQEPSDSDPIIVKADEVDEAGADISTISPDNTSSESDFNARIESRRAHDAEASDGPKLLANAVPSPPRSIARPILRREGSAPAPPTQPPPAPPRQEDVAGPTDSLSLLQLKKLVGDLPKLEPTAYAYEYEETRSFPEELQEWFQYTEEERFIILGAKESFDEAWHPILSAREDVDAGSTSWTDAPEADRRRLVKQAVSALDSEDVATRVNSLGALSYILLGAWEDTAGVDYDVEEHKLSKPTMSWLDLQTTKPAYQMQWMISGVRMLWGRETLSKLIDLLKMIWESEQSVSHLLPQFACASRICHADRIWSIG